MVNKLLSILGISLFSFASPAYGFVLQESKVYDLKTNLAIEDASATLTRMQDGVELNLDTTLPGEATYTVWWLIFNNPESCVDGCGVDDLRTSSVNASVFWAAGDITGIDGKASFNSKLPVGFLPSGLDRVLFGPGLSDPFSAEIHNIVRSHGPVISGLEKEQISTFNGGCPPNICADLQFAVFPSVSATTPEPTSALGFLAFGILGAGSFLKQRQLKLSPSTDNENHRN